MSEAIRLQNAPIVELYANTNLNPKNTATRLDIADYIANVIGDGFLEGLELLISSPIYLKRTPRVEQVVKAMIPAGRKVQPSHSTDATLIHIWFRQLFPDLYNGRSSVPSTSLLVPGSQSTEFEACTKLILHQHHFLHTALSTRYYPLAAFLLDIADKDDLQVTIHGGGTPLHEFAAHNCTTTKCESCLSITKRIVEIDGATSANTPDKDGNLPIHLAASHDSPSVIFEFLIRSTNNLNHKNSAGKSLIHCAHKHASLIRMLVESGRVDLFSRNDKGETVFSAEIKRPGDKPDVLETLVEADARLAWTADDTMDRLTPLHHALTENDEDYEALSLLLSCSDVEKVLRSFLDSTASASADARQKVREFAREQNLEGAVEVMDRIGF